MKVNSFLRTSYKGDILNFEPQQKGLGWRLAMDLIVDGGTLVTKDRF